MPGPGGNQPKSKKAGPKKMVKASATGRYHSGYGPDVTVGNPGAGVTKKKYSVSDAIRGWGSHNSKTPYGG